MKRLIYTVACLAVAAPALGKANIFAPPPIVIKKPEKKVKVVVSNNPLQKYNLEAYRITGILYSGTVKKAMVVAPDRKTYFVKVGDFLGNRGERIIDINEKGLVLLRGKKMLLLPLPKKK